MPLNARVISDRVIRKLDSIGIQSNVGGAESETAALVRLIVEQLVYALQNEANVKTTVTGACSNSAGPGSINGFGVGDIK